MRREAARAIGGGRTGVCLSPVTPANDAFGSNPQPLFEDLVKPLASLGLAHAHITVGVTGAARKLAD